MRAITLISVRMRRPPTINTLANRMGHILISERMRPESVERMRSRDWEKWWDHIWPDKRCATVKEKRVWKRLTARPKNALNRNAPIIRKHKAIRKREGVSMPMVETALNAVRRMAFV